MRQTYETPGIVLARAPVGEVSAAITILTPEVGLIHARAQGLRRSGAKLSPALVTFAQSDLALVRGREYWRIAGAVLQENWLERISLPSARVRAARVTGLLLRLVAGEANDTTIFSIVTGFFATLASAPEAMHDTAEILAAIRLLAALGFDAGELPGEASSFAPEILAKVTRDRSRYIARINRGIAASGL